MANNGKIEGKDVIDGLYEEIKKSDEALKQMLKTINTIKSNGFTLPKTSSSDSNKEYTGELDKIALKLKEREALIKKVAVAEERQILAERKISQSLAQTRFETQKINQLNKSNAIQVSKYADAYDKLSNRLNTAKRNLKNLTIEQGANAAATKKAQAEVTKLAAKVKQADAAAGDFQRNVGNYPKTFIPSIASLRNLASAFGLVSAIQITGQIYEQIKAIDSMNKALKQVVETEEAFSDAQIFLKSVADEAGAGILDLTKAYTKFLASARTTNLRTSQTQEIFRQVAKAAGVLGLSADDTTGALRALEQMMSKGTVQAEEIRGQLGERLPGAFQILAKSMGLTTAELGKQLELGNVMAEDVLPKFAAELEKAYSLDKVERVQTMASEQERLKNAWLEFVEGVEDGEGVITKVLGFVMQGLSEIVQGLTILTKSADQLTKKFESGLGAEAYRVELNALNEDAEKTGKTLRQVALGRYLDANNDVALFSNKLAELRKQEQDLVELGNKRISIEERRQNIERLSDVREDIELTSSSLAIREGTLRAINEVLSDTVKKTKEVKEETKSLSKTKIDLTPKVSKLEVDEKGLQDDFDKQIRNLAKALELEGFEFDLKFGTSGIQDATDELEAYQQNRIEKEQNWTDFLAREKEKQKEIFKNTFNSFAKYYDLDLTAFQDLLDRKSALDINYAATANSIVESIYAGKQEKYNVDLERKRAYLDATLSDETKTDKQKAIAQRKFDEEERKLNNKKAKAERDAILFKIAIDTAEGLAKTLITAFSLAANPLTAALAPNAFAQAAAIGASGLAQAAIVKSTKLPQFFKGKDANNNFEGLATWGEHRPEVLIDKYGGVEFSPNGTTPKFIKKDDIIVPSIPKFFNQIENPNSDVAKRISKRLGKETKERQMIINNSNANYSDNRKLEEKLDRLIALQSAVANRPINVKATIEQPLTRY